MGIGKFIGAIFMGTVDVIDSVSAPFIEARDRVDAKEAQAKKREERKLQHTLEEEELRKDRQLRDLQIEQLLDEKAKKEAEPKKIPAKKKINRKSPQTLLRKKRVIDKKLKDGLITERTAVIQTNKAIAAEKMRLFIENQGFFYLLFVYKIKPWIKYIIII